MTCREKLKLEHPEYVGSDWSGGCKGCPHAYGYLPKPRSCRDIDCNECWDQEIPGTEHVNKKHMAFANEMKAIYTSLMDAGFTSDQAFELMKCALQASVMGGAMT